MLTTTLLLLRMLSPEQAVVHAAHLVGRPDIAPALLRVCRRESRCQRIGVHEIDAHPRASSYVGQVQLGHLNPECQPKGDYRRWGTRGIMGLNAADHWQYLPECYQPEVLDVPIVSAVVAAKKYLRQCEGRKRRRWCPRRR